MIVDDMESMRTLVTQFLRRNDHVAVVGEASDGDEAMSKVQEYHPDLVLLDMSLQSASGVEVARKIKSIMPDVRIYFFSAYDVNEYRQMELDSPAEGFIQKSALKSELQQMIKIELERKGRRS